MPAPVLLSSCHEIREVDRKCIFSKLRHQILTKIYRDMEEGQPHNSMKFQTVWSKEAGVMCIWISDRHRRWQCRQWSFIKAVWCMLHLFKVHLFSSASIAFCVVLCCTLLRQSPIEIACTGTTCDIIWKVNNLHLYHISGLSWFLIVQACHCPKLRCILLYLLPAAVSLSRFLTIRM